MEVAPPFKLHIHILPHLTPTPFGTFKNYRGIFGLQILMTWLLREHDTAVYKVDNLYLQDFHFKQAIPNTRKSRSEVRGLKSKHEEWRHGTRGIEKQIEEKLMIEEKHKDNNRYEIKVGWYFEEKKGRELKKWVINTNHQKQIGSYKVKTRKLPRGENMLSSQ